ncbi:hypothetical protein WK11_16415 [Burkholderia ubonensis]|uniref:hypothetical protein n=1 Tax=Burkholderia ubonensis TaxID=101571 RepID=UPI000753C51A|nr:hypothetical protein [Burkholderia ubonensis]KVO80318.1 hypothetical protein WJ80_21425 [Burkholderia ubonensis]KVP33144.1 hypothetical protein WJ85_24210 [Burkholderia ubonensis]KVR04187.1 hypothetical protein WK11_16415 [Burkholderia ubonensis]KVR35660.1 hypothetical protein WK14_27000 [Burkholderia ubonensis]KWD25687.1 hypothetical protein WL61_07305 [Burkholderia ubonensis]
MSNSQEIPLHEESRFWENTLVKRWVRGHGEDGYDFRLLLYPLAGIFVLLFVLVLFEQIGWALLLSAAVTLFVGVAGYYGAKREILVSSPTTRAVMRARTKQAAERFSSLGAGATVMAIFVHATSVSLALYGHMLLDTMIKDAFSMFIALAFLPVYVCGAVRKLAVARVEELDALRNDATGTTLKFDRKGAVRAIVVQGPAGWSSVSVLEYTVLRFKPDIDEIGRAP